MTVLERKEDVRLWGRKEGSANKHSQSKSSYASTILLTPPSLPYRFPNMSSPKNLNSTSIPPSRKSLMEVEHLLSQLESSRGSLIMDLIRGRANLLSETQPLLKWVEPFVTFLFEWSLMFHFPRELSWTIKLMAEQNKNWAKTGNLLKGTLLTVPGMGKDHTPLRMVQSTILCNIVY